MLNRRALSGKRYFKKYIVILVICFFTVNIVGCSGLQDQNKSKNSKYPLYADSGNTKTDASSKKNSWWEEHGKKLVLMSIAVFVGGMLIYIAYRQNDNDSNIPMSPPPPPPPMDDGPGM